MLGGRAWLELALVLAVPLLVLGAPRVFAPTTASLAVAIRQLGPVSGWR